MTKKILLLFAALLIYSLQSNAQIVPNDRDYQVLKKDNHRLVYSKDNLDVAEYALNKFIEVSNLYNKEYGWALDQTPTLVLTSNKNQFQNGFATTSPRLVTTFFPAYTTSNFSTHSWVDTLIYHEVAHLYQLNAKPSENSLPALGQKALGNPTFLLIPPLMINPNSLLPGLFTEGNATWNESRFSNGGRLHSGQNLALVNQMALSGKIKANIDMNSTLEFPLSREYLVGSYFQEFLAKKFGQEKLNQYFVTQSGYYFWPLIINRTFKKHFGESFYKLFAEFSRTQAENAIGFTKSSAPILFKSFTHSSFNHSKDHIYFSVNTKINSYPKVITFNKSTEQITKKSKDIKRGKLFRINDKWAVSASGKVKKTKRAYTLYKTKARYHKKYIDHAVLDMRGTSWASFYVPKSYKKNQLYKNGEFFSESDSEAILDEAGNIYYFKQEGNSRSLYKNTTTLFSIEGHYGYPLEVLDNGAITFIAPSKHGSALYIFENGSTKRLHDSDAIIDARQISGDKYLVSEVSFDGYNYKTVTTVPIFTVPEAPTLSFSKDSDLLAGSQASDSLVKKYKYNSMSQLKLGYFSPDFVRIGSGINVGAGASALWIDPMQRNSIQASYSIHGNESLGLALYQNTINSVRWGLGIKYKKEDRLLFSTTLNSFFDETSTQLTPFASINYLIFDQLDAKSSLNIAGGHVTRELETVNFKETGTFAEAVLDFTWQKRFSRSFDSHRLFSIGLTQGYENLENSITKISEESISYSAYANAKYNIGSEIYLGARHSHFYSESNNIEIDSQNSDYFSLSRNIETLRNLSATEFSIKKAFHTPLYSARLPLSLRRIAPKISATYFDYKELPVNQNFNFTEVAAFLEMEILLVHKAPIKFALGIAKNRGSDSEDQPYNWQIVLNL